MTIKVLNDSEIWKQFEIEAKKRRRNPVKIVMDLLREQMENWEDESLDREISLEAQKSDYKEEDAVELVRQYRREKNESAAP